MKVLEEGKDLEWEREIICPHCNSKLLITADDIEYRASVSYVYDFRYYVVCHGHDVLVQDPQSYGQHGQCSTALKEVIPEHILLAIKQRSRLDAEHCNKKSK